VTVPRYRLAILDFDGTLANSGDWFLRISDDLSRRFGYRAISADEVEMLRGRTTREIIRFLGIPRWKIPRIARHLHKLMGEHADQIALFEGTETLIRALASSGVRIAIVTSNSEVNVRAILGPANAAYIDWFECGASLFGKAPRYRRVLRKSGLSRRETISIGDETRDIVAARKAGISAGAVVWGYANRAALTRFDPDALFETPDDIMRLIIGGPACSHRSG
jgi:phosphoglycolate phosphatase